MANRIPARPRSGVTVGVSACLLGERVRYDGDHRQGALNPLLSADLLRLVGFCPEVGIGLGTPREPIRLTAVAGEVRARRVHTGGDVTLRLRDYADVLVASYAPRFAGIIFMSRSPSCGIGNVPIVSESAGVVGEGDGIVAGRCRSLLPEMPIEHSSALQGIRAVESFVERVLTYAHWRILLAEGLGRDKLDELHAVYQYLLLAHSPAHARRAQRLLDERGSQLDVLERYLSNLMLGLTQHTTVRKHARVLQCLKLLAPRRSRGVLQRAIAAYANGTNSLQTAVDELSVSLAQVPEHLARANVYLDPHVGARQLRSQL